MKIDTSTLIAPTYLTRSYEAARTITKNYAKTFYFASAFLPRAQRNHAYAIYAFCRTADSLVDDAEGRSIQEIQKSLEELRQFIWHPDTSVLAYPWAVAFRETMQTLRIPARLFEELLQGVQMDLYKNRYDTFEELYLYAYRVAGVVGQMMCYVYGLTDPESLAYAEKLGVAMQLTNILRDVGEDWGRGRLYLPQEDLLRLGVREDEIASGRPTAAYETLIRYQIGRARAYYREAAPGIARIPFLPLRLTTLLMARLYEGILDKLEKNPSQNLSCRTALSRAEKYLVGSQTFLGLMPLGEKTLPKVYRYAVGMLFFLTPFAVADATTGVFDWIAGLSDSLYLFLWGGVAAYAVAMQNRGAFAAWGLSVLLGYMVELIGTQTGYPFGPYSYTGVLWPQLFGVPLAIAGAWGSLVGLWAMIGPTRVYARALWTSLGAVATDLLLEPYATTIRHYWHWHMPEIPLSNYLSWGAFAVMLSFLYPRALSFPAYPPLIDNLGRALLFVLTGFLLIANLGQGVSSWMSVLAAAVISLMLLWRRT